MADSSSNHPNNASFSDRLVKIEVLLEQVLTELTKGNTKFEKIEIQFEKVHSRITEVEKELSARMSPIGSNYLDYYFKISAIIRGEIQ